MYFKLYVFVQKLDSNLCLGIFAQINQTALSSKFLNFEMLRKRQYLSNFSFQNYQKYNFLGN